MKQSTIRATLWVKGDDPTNTYNDLREKLTRVAGVLSIDENITDAGETVKVAIRFEFADQRRGMRLVNKLVRLLRGESSIHAASIQSIPSDLIDRDSPSESSGA